MRNFVLKDFSQEVDYITNLPQRFAMRIEAERQTGMHTIDVVGALHGELQSLVPLDATEGDPISEMRRAALIDSSC